MNRTITIITLLCLLLAPADSFAKKKKKKEKTTVEQTIAKPAEQKDETKDFVMSNPVKQLSGEWTVKKLRNKAVTTSERAYLNFDVKNSRLYGSNGCNVINGKFSLTDANITFADIVTTHNSCNNNSASRNIMKAIAETTNLIITEENGIEYLILRNKSNHELLRLKRHNFDFANGAWAVKEIDGEPITQNAMKLVIDTDQLSVHADTGCNIVNGIITIDSDKYHAIQFEDLISTRKMCKNINYETALLVALEQTVSARLDANSHLQLVDNKGKVVAVLEKLHMSK
ncbi:MAG: META domain-containing protein [Muribaculaceae bacterium]